MVRWWLKKLMNIHAREGCKTALAFGIRDRSVGLMLEYNEILHYFLRRIQAEKPNLISPTDELEINYIFLWSFRRTVKGRALAANLDSRVQKATNRWRKIEEAKGKHPQFNMVDYYTHAQYLILVT